MTSRILSGLILIWIMRGANGEIYSIHAPGLPAAVYEIVAFPVPEGMSNVSGHRDCNTTICPGGYVYDRLPLIRAAKRRGKDRRRTRPEWLRGAMATQQIHYLRSAARLRICLYFSYLQ